MEAWSGRLARLVGASTWLSAQAHASPWRSRSLEMRLVLFATVVASSHAYTLGFSARSHHGCRTLRPARTSCQMHLGERFVRRGKSNVDSALSSRECPETVLVQAVLDM